MTKSIGIGEHEPQRRRSKSAAATAPRPDFDREAAGLQSATAEEVLAWAADRFFPDVAIASSFGAEDVVLMDLALKVRPDFPVFAIDTGRLPDETYAVAERWRERGARVQWLFPERQAVEALVEAHGLFSFRDSVEARRACCAVRKVEPLRRALFGLEAWVTGLRREQSVTREEIAKVERDAANGGLFKLNPLADWSEAQLWEHIRANRLPYNALHDRGYPSIGCAPCTRAVAPGEHARSGRWWWESPEHKECGLHYRKQA